MLFPKSLENCSAYRRRGTGGDVCSSALEVQAPVDLSTLSRRSCLGALRFRCWNRRRAYFYPNIRTRCHIRRRHGIFTLVCVLMCAYQGFGSRSKTSPQSGSLFLRTWRRKNTEPLFKGNYYHLNYSINSFISTPSLHLP